MSVSYGTYAKFDIPAFNFQRQHYSLSVKNPVMLNSLLPFQYEIKETVSFQKYKIKNILIKNKLFKNTNIILHVITINV